MARPGLHAGDDQPPQIVESVAPPRGLLRPWIAWSLAGGLAATPFGAGSAGFAAGCLLMAALALSAFAQRRSIRLASDEPPWRSCLAAIFFLGVFLVYVSNQATLSSGDNLPNRSLPAALISGDGFDLSRVVQASDHDHYSLLRRDGRLLSAFPLGTGVAAAPYYAVARAVSGADPMVLASSARLEKHLAALLSAFSAVMFLRGLRLVASGPPQFAAAGLYSLGTPLLSSTSQGLWSQTGELFFLSLALFVLADIGRGPLRETLAGGACAYAYFCRPTAVLLFPVLWALAPAERKPRASFALAALAGVLAFTAVQLALYGQPLGGYGALNSEVGFWGASGFPERAAGVLLSPSRGFVWFFPLFAVALFRVPGRPTTDQERRIWATSAFATFALLVVTASYGKWWGGWSLGPRLLAELALPLGLLAANLFRRLSGRVEIAVVGALLLFQVATQLALQQSENAREWNEAVTVDQNPRVLWSVRNGQLAAAFIPGWTYVDPAPYFDRATLAQAAGPFEWTPVDLRPSANERYDDPRGALFLPRLARADPSWLTAGHLKLLPPAQTNTVRVCEGEAGPRIALHSRRVRRVDALLTWRAAPATRPLETPAGSIVLYFQSGRVQRERLQVGRDVFGPVDLASSASLPAHRVYGGSVLARDVLVRKRIALAGSNRVLTHLQIEGPPGGAGCFYLLAASVSGE